MNLWVIFLTGLTTGGLTCLAMQGGLLASTIANQKERELLEGGEQKQSNGRSLEKHDWLPVSYFLIVKLISHTLLGFLLGALGSVISLSLGIRITFQIFTVLFMTATALNLLNVHPIFRFVAFQPPRFLTRLVARSSKSQTTFAPAVLGFLTVFVPCGVTQAMEVLAISSGSAATGALIMFAFVLGTFPLFSIIGLATAKLSEKFHQAFLKFAAVILIAMSLYGANGILTVLDAPVTFQKTLAALQSDEPADVGAENAPFQAAEFQDVTINIENNGYSPRAFRVNVGVPVRLTLESNGVYSCAAAFTMRSFDIYETLKPTDQKTVSFVPTKKGKYTFSCTMGMYTGVMEVI